MKALQINLNHCWAAQQLLAQTMKDRSTDVILVSEYYKVIADEK